MVNQKAKANDSFMSSLKDSIIMITNPAAILKKKMQGVSWQVALIIPGSAFSLFFLQTGIDLFRNGSIGLIRVVLMGLLGVIYGTIGVTGLSIICFFITKSMGTTKDMKWAISTFAMGYSGTLVYAVTGLIFSSLLGWNTAVAFGVTGVLWALRPMMATIRHMTNGNATIGVILSTICGTILLFGWALLSQLGV
ncbi:hypothetical protein [Clostridium grantii]|uniref:Yip1 domain-containing protein n=1 Tax=Clostridium grantii DSM 8605 TaxID=1121316 RepID=A0A1M5QGG0_9CLOT|nr:hypothetical protein [Clostridium grantii]SHH12941.1 hypothetical protein SAMN02745207_00068 [Clostridium grantii DSM 8605]